jgi:uncharacterized protein involved in exopolysaccharide biosynthesis
MTIQDQDGYGAEVVRAKAFSLRALEILFRHKIMFLLPIVAFTALGFYRASQVSPVYQASAVLSTASNPLLEEQLVRGVTLERFESPAEGTSRIIGEQLRTAAFTEEIVERVGLSDALEAGLIDLDTVRENISTTADGSSLLSIEATWADPVTAYQVVNGVIETYLEYLADTAASDSSEAVSFYEGIRDIALEERTERQNELEQYLSTLPAVESERDRPISVQLRIDELTAQISDADERVGDAERNIDEAHLSVLQSRSNAGRSVQVIDEATVPTAPEAALPQRVAAIGSGFLIGSVIAVAALLFAALLDRTVSAPEDLTSLPGVSLVVVVPPERRRRTKAARRSRRRTRERADVDVDVRQIESAAT